MIEALLLNLLVLFIIVGIYLIVFCLCRTFKYAIIDHKSEPGDYCTLAPDFDIGYICARHDECYGVGGTKLTRYLADTRFRDSIMRHGRMKGQPMRYWLLAWVYYLVVRVFGHWKFEFLKANF